MFCNKPLSAMIIVICFTFIKLIKFINSTCFPFRSWIYFIWVYFIFFCVISFFLILLLWLIVFFVFASCRIRLPISIVSCTIFATICWFTFFILWKELFSIALHAHDFTTKLTFQQNAIHTGLGAYRSTLAGTLRLPSNAFIF